MDLSIQTFFFLIITVHTNVHIEITTYIDIDRHTIKRISVFIETFVYLWKPFKTYKRSHQAWISSRYSFWLLKRASNQNFEYTLKKNTQKSLVVVRKRWIGRKLLKHILKPSYLASSSICFLRRGETAKSRQGVCFFLWESVVGEDDHSVLHVARKNIGASLQNSNSLVAFLMLIFNLLGCHHCRFLALKELLMKFKRSPLKYRLTSLLPLLNSLSIVSYTGTCINDFLIIWFLSNPLISMSQVEFSV